MKQLTLLLISFFSISTINAQDISGAELLSKSIAYHDPNGQWDSFNGTFNVYIRENYGEYIKTCI